MMKRIVSILGPIAAIVLVVFVVLLLIHSGAIVGFFHYFYIPSKGAWYTGNVWGNVFVIVVVAPLGWIWAKTKYWPLHPIHVELSHLHSKTSEMLGHHRQHALKLDRLASSHVHLQSQQLDQIALLTEIRDLLVNRGSESKVVEALDARLAEPSSPALSQTDQLPASPHRESSTRS
jgi:hypothetical protein